MRTKPEFINGEIYHVYNRGVEKRDIFLDENDFQRFISRLFHCNNSIFLRSGEDRPRDLLVEIQGFVLMDNHFHLVVRQLQDGGIVRFMRKLGTAYVMYFNRKYNRVGPLFQNRFQAVHVKSQDQFQYLLYYVHLNPLDFSYYEWRSGSLEKPQEALRWLYTYPWTSLFDYVGVMNFYWVLWKDGPPNIDFSEYRKNFEEYVISLGPSSI